jgi:hypothetical protein
VSRFEVTVTEREDAGASGPRGAHGTVCGQDCSEVCDCICICTCISCDCIGGGPSAVQSTAISPLADTRVR